jgi:broad specificity phosphatase PhoE
MPLKTKKIYLIRHGETEWTLSGQHTGTTDIPLTQEGERQVEELKKRINKRDFSTILTSPLKRAIQTCELTGYLNRAKIDPDLMEWNYGDFEGKTSKEIHALYPQWSIFFDGAPNGESLADIEARTSRVLAKLEPLQGNIALFSHGHFLRALAAKWLQLSVREGRLFTLVPASLSILGYEKTTPVIQLWNDTSHL